MYYYRQYSMLDVEFVLLPYSKWCPCTPALIEAFLILHKESKADLGRYL